MNPGFCSGLSADSAFTETMLRQTLPVQALGKICDDAELCHATDAVEKQQVDVLFAYSRTCFSIHQPDWLADDPSLAARIIAAFHRRPM